MDLRLFIEGEAVEIRVEREGDKLLLQHDGINHRYEVTSVGENEYLLRNANKVTRVTAIKTRNKVYVLTDNEEHVFDLPASKDGDSFGAEAGDHGDKSKISAPMPGKIVKVLVKVGDTVEPKQKLVIVEAMKTMNAITAPKGGTVTEINVADGTPVEFGQTLCVIA